MSAWLWLAVVGGSLAYLAVGLAVATFMRLHDEEYLAPLMGFFWPVCIAVAPFWLMEEGSAMAARWVARRSHGR